METISSILLQYVDKDTKCVIGTILKYCYRPNIRKMSSNLEQQLYIEEILCRRRCLDWCLLHMANKYGIPQIPGLIIIPNYISTDNIKQIKRKVKKDIEYKLDLPSWLKMYRPFATNVANILCHDTENITNYDEEKYGDYVSMINIGKESNLKFESGNINIPTGSLVIFTYQSRHQNVTLQNNTGAIIFKFYTDKYPEQLNGMKLVMSELPTYAAVFQPIAND